MKRKALSSGAVTEEYFRIFHCRRRKRNVALNNLPFEEARDLGEATLPVALHRDQQADEIRYYTGELWNVKRVNAN